MADTYTKAEIEEVQEMLTFICHHIAKRPEQTEWRQAVAMFRKIPVEYFKDCFFIPNIDYLRTVVSDTYYTDLRYGFMSTLGSSPLAARFVIPCFNARGKVAGLVGYDNESPNYKYLLTTTIGFTKSNVTYGHQDLDTILKQGYVILVEGIMDYFRLKSIGLPVMSLQGTNLYKNNQWFLKKLKFTITFLDTDNAGMNAMGYIHQALTDQGRYTKSPLDVAIERGTQRHQLTRNINIQLRRDGVSKIDPDIFLSYQENITYFKEEIEKIKQRGIQDGQYLYRLFNQSPELEQHMRDYLEKRKNLSQEDNRDKTK
jgi:hypothetical protein